MKMPRDPIKAARHFLLFLQWAACEVTPEQRVLMLIGQTLVGPVALAQVGRAFRGTFPIAPIAAAVQEQP